MQENKYDQVKLSTVITSIQKARLQILNKQRLPKRMERELADMVTSAISRLQKMDRSSPEFFQPGYLVECTIPSGAPVHGDDIFGFDSEPDKVFTGRVDSIDETHCTVQSDEDWNNYRLHPNLLKILYIR